MDEKIINLKGQVFGLWKVLKLGEENTPGVDKKWLCQCECGNIREVCGGKLRQGTSTSCGCSCTIDITGQVFGTWKALRLVRDHKRKSKWVCESTEDGSIMLFSKVQLKGLPPAPMSQIRKENIKPEWKKVADANQEMSEDKFSWKPCYKMKGTIYVCKKKGWVTLLKEGKQLPPCPDVESLKVVTGGSRYHDMKGEIHGDYEVVAPLQQNHNRLMVWECKCQSCGKTREITSLMIKREPKCRFCKTKSIERDITELGIEGWDIVKKTKDGKFLCKCQKCQLEKVYSGLYMRTHSPKCVCCHECDCEKIEEVEVSKIAK